MRHVIRATLQRSGYQVLEAPDGGAALTVLERHTGSVDLLLADVVMPHMSGLELFTKIHARDTAMRVLYTSGYTDDILARHGVLDSAGDLIRKPFTPNQLLARVRDVLDRPDLSTSTARLDGGTISAPPARSSP
jgi:DNA-binding response OmpR family regulator